jgi:N-acetylglucosamine-6-sulfatase
VPLVIRGPRVQAGSSSDELVLDTDYFPTFMDMAGAPTPSYPVDGRSLLPVLTGGAYTSRTAILIEGRAGDDPEIPVDRNYNGIRTSTNKYVESEGGFKELYNLYANSKNPDADPYELTNIYDNTNNSGGPTEPPLSALDSRLDELKQCKGTGPEAPSCEAAEDKPFMQGGGE